MTTEERGSLVVVIRKYCRALKVMDSSTQKDANEAMKMGVYARTTAARQYYTALQYVKQIDPAWNMLTDVEQYVLDEFYGRRTHRSGAAGRVAEEYEISERQAYYISAKARQRFADALEKFGIKEDDCDG